MRQRLFRNSAVYFLFWTLLLFTVTRFGLAVYARTLTTGSDVPVFLWPLAFAKGFWFDLATIAYLGAPLLLYEALLPQRIKGSRFHYWARIAWVFFSLAILLFGAVSEFVFWGEFSTRFNFIAVDYLLYTHEVVNNVLQSYPVGALLAAIGATAMVATWLSRKSVAAADRRPLSVRQRLAYGVMAFMLPLFSTLLADVDQMQGSGNAYIDELSGNGLFSLAAAMRRNELDYERFYKTIPQQQADAILAGLEVERPALARLSLSPSLLVNTQQSMDDGISRTAQARPKHVVLISVESLSAKFLGAYGSTEDLTPNLDRLSKEGWLFTNVYATGTRTVRGLEALSVGTPPIPGQSIVRRPANEHLSTIGEVLEEHGYSSSFIYGGYGYFDNMNAYFSGNDYRVVDRTDFDDQSVVFENAWGVADESLFNNALLVIDRDINAGRKVYAHIMTTSNHRPYTYPDGRIDIPSPGKRRGAVKYTDYAIGKFIADAKRKPWFNDTLFVVVADHCASAAGKTKLPVKNYRIPLLMYAPQMLQPAKFDRMVSQIDVPPTVLDMLGIASDGEFYGKSIFRQRIGEERAFISNYQELGYLKDNTLTVLSPQQKVEAFAVDPETLEMAPTAVSEALEKEAIAYYQSASLAFKQGRLRARHHSLGQL